MGSENKICFLFQSTHPRRVWQCELFTLFRFWYVSIHTPTKGVTSESYLKTLGPWSFNPHTHEGCDTAIANSDVAKRSFNPHTHEGCDTSLTKKMLERFSFQSTHPRRVWHRHSSPTEWQRMFQSTHPRRVWLAVDDFVNSSRVFQSTHPRRVWPARPCIKAAWPCFNPHTHEGCDLSNSLTSSRSFVSIHTPTKGVTL